MRAEHAQGTPIQSHVSPSILVYKGQVVRIQPPKTKIVNSVNPAFQEAAGKDAGKAPETFCFRTGASRIELVSDNLTLFCPKNFQTSKLNQSTRVVKFDVYYTIRPFTRTPGQKVG